MMSVLATHWYGQRRQRTRLTRRWPPSKVLQHEHGLLEVPCTYLILPCHIRHRARFITFDLPQPPPGNVVVADTTIGPMEHKKENKCSNIMAYCGGALKHVEPRHEPIAVFHEDGTHPSVEVGLRVANASKPGDELGAVLVVIEPVLGPMLDPTQQHPP